MQAGGADASPTQLMLHAVLLVCAYCCACEAANCDIDVVHVDVGHIDNAGLILLMARLLLAEISKPGVIS